MARKLTKTTIILAAALGMIAVILGAMGAHALKESLSAAMLNSFETAVRYQMWHALALLALATNLSKIPTLRWVVLLWGLGVLLFSGSIYLLSTRQLTDWQVDWLGPITPIGGLLLIVGWGLLGLAAWRHSFPSRAKSQTRRTE